MVIITMMRESIIMNKYFKKQELECKKCCGEVKLADGFADKLNILREAFNQPMIVNSACRCEKKNKSVGGAANSYHLLNNRFSNGTCAVDIARRNYAYDTALIKTAIELGWSIGVAKTFIHLDRRSDYGQPNVLYIY